MDEETLQKHYNILRKTYGDFLTRRAEFTERMDSKNNDLEAYLSDLDSYVDQEPELHTLLTSGDKAINLNDLKSIEHFDREMSKALIKIELLLEEME